VESESLAVKVTEASTSSEERESVSLSSSSRSSTRMPSASGSTDAQAAKKALWERKTPPIRRESEGPPSGEDHTQGAGTCGTPPASPATATRIVSASSHLRACIRARLRARPRSHPA